MPLIQQSNVELRNRKTGELMQVRSFDDPRIEYCRIVNESNSDVIAVIPKTWTVGWLIGIVAGSLLLHFGLFCVECSLFHSPN